MLPDTSEDFGVGKALVLLLVELGERVKLLATISTRDARRITQIEHGIALAAQQDALMIGR